MFLVGNARITNLDRKNKKCTFTAVYDNSGKDAKVFIEYWKDDQGNDPFKNINEGDTKYLCCSLSNRKKTTRSNESGQWVTKDVLDSGGYAIWEKVFTLKSAKDQKENDLEQNIDDELPF